eukprot:5134663-Pyramimonas_sp.AAC.1
MPHPSLLNVVTIESHMAVEEAANAGTMVCRYPANAMADEAAGFWAEKCVVPNAVVSAVEHALRRSAEQCGSTWP